eukprot:m.441275 g.441275  ORF g.441275 m.441275 type:complete len:57 (+) comp20281_c3_seq1:622-792(+)
MRVAVDASKRASMVKGAGQESFFAPSPTTTLQDHRPDKDPFYFDFDFDARGPPTDF